MQDQTYTSINKVSTKKLKGCFLLQRRFAFIGHDIARHLKDAFGITEFCGYVYRRSSYDFLKAQKDIAYSTLLLDEDIHEQYKNEKLDPEYLNALEKEYGIPFLWPFLSVDRVLMSNQLVREYPYSQSPYSHDELLRLVQVHARAILGMLDRERPDFLLCSVLGGLGSLFLYHAAKKRGIKTIVVLPACIRDRYLLSEEYASFTDVDRMATEQMETLKASREWDEAGSFLQTFREAPIPYFAKTTPLGQAVTRTRQLRFLLPWNTLKYVRTLKAKFEHHWHSLERNDYSYIGPWNYLKDATKRKLRNMRGLDDLYDPFTPEEDFAFYPLHYEPEVALLLQAPYHTDQIELIQKIAQSLPVRFKLYVKEHPAMVEYRPRWYYERLKKIPNVKLISPTLSSYQIIPRTKLIFTITGTVGWEGVLLKKPVISFGHHFYNSLPMVSYCHDIEQLPALISDRLHHDAHNEDILRSFLAAVFTESATLDLNHLWYDEEDAEKRKAGVRPLAELLAKKLGLSPQKESSSPPLG